MNLRKIFKKKKKNIPTLYNEQNYPINPPLGSRRNPKSKKRKTQHHKLQKPSSFTKQETEELLAKESIKVKELE